MLNYLELKVFIRETQVHTIKPLAGAPDPIKDLLFYYCRQGDELKVAELLHKYKFNINCLVCLYSLTQLPIYYSTTNIVQYRMVILFRSQSIVQSIMQQLKGMYK